MLKGLRLTGFSRRMAVSFSILIFIVIVFQQIATDYVIRFTVQDINKNYIQVILKQKNEKLTKFVADLDLFSKTIISNREIQALLVKGRNADAFISRFSPELSYAISNEIEGFFIVSKSGAIYQEAEIELVEYVHSHIAAIERRLEHSRGEMLFSRSEFVRYAAKNRGDHFFLVARKIRDLDTFQDIGFIIMVVRETKLWDNFTMEGDIGAAYIADRQGNIIAGRPERWVGANVYGEYGKILQKGILNAVAGSALRKGFVINFITNDVTQWKLLSIVSINDLNKNYANIQRLILIIGIVAIIVAIYISVIISQKITGPVRELVRSMRKVMAGNLNVNAAATSAADPVDEMKELNEVFNEMTKELRYLIEEVYQENLREKEAELRALKAQINPHFLYNTLDTIYWMLVLKGDEETSVLITKLGEILRYSIKKGNSNVTVQEELQQIENYLFIQKARFEDALTYELQVDPNIFGCEILSFLIQPFVENAVNHGITNGRGYGKVLIKGYRQGENLIFEISDDGKGMTEAQLATITAQKNHGDPVQRGIGIANVHHRIKYYYGSPYGVKIESEIDKGTKVTIMLPTTEA
ncbi:histidine kinase/DNA gyrase B/HSP90-like ATPase [Hydrogenispora ethanolica]|uniref:histidine kinase n=1 Tax=Hydrogenispora ethanolica TaxID=1082276 RepID=A0A4R1R7A4_HYDET|nr:histidine kinase [Hydrogenispora ethanolica]TCL61501.1 histidine kinase/DNA gyrase B/HSP90-like ATPase [Hydrogenispora ethanolica]